VKRFPFLTAGIIFAPVAVAIGFISGGFGHGNYVAARLVLPWACTATGEYVGAAAIITVLALLQWPVYGLLIDRTKRKSFAVVSIVILHAGLCLLLFTAASERF
jgi:MFS family permease